MIDTDLWDVDESIASVVSALNQLPDLSSFSSCGGHHPRIKPSQEAAGHFYISFVVKPTMLGWWSLAAVSYVAMAMEDVKLMAWYNGLTDAEFDPTALAFQLKGGPRCSREELAALIVNAVWSQPK